MKKRLIAAVTAVLLLSSCGMVDREKSAAELSDGEDTSASESAETVSEETEPDDSEAEDGGQGSDTDDSSAADSSGADGKYGEFENFVSIDLTDSTRTGVLGVGVAGSFGRADLRNMYGVHVLHTGVVGLFGCPVEFTAEDFGDGIIQFNVDRDNMSNVPIENLAMLHYNETDGFYDYTDFVVDRENYRVTAGIDEPGVYLLVNDLSWRNVWGMDIDGLTIPEPADTVYNGDQPFEKDSYPFTITIDKDCEGFSHTENYSTDEIDYHCFYRITSMSSSLPGLVWIDIAHVTTAQPTDLEGFVEIMKRARPEMYGPYIDMGYEPVKQEDIVSADGTPGIRVEYIYTYDASTDYASENTTYCDYYPDGMGGYYELRAEYLDDTEYDPEGISDAVSEKILSSFTITG